MCTGSLMALERGRSRLIHSRVSKLGMCITKDTSMGFLFSECVSAGARLQDAAGTGCLCA